MAIQALTSENMNKKYAAENIKKASPSKIGGANNHVIVKKSRQQREAELRQRVDADWLQREHNFWDENFRQIIGMDARRPDPMFLSHCNVLRKKIRLFMEKESTKLAKKYLSEEFGRAYLWVTDAF